MKQPPFRLIYEGEWSDIMCVDYPLTKERLLEEDMHPLLNTQVDAFTYNLCSSDGYVCQLENGELLMRSVEKFADAWCWRYRENTKKLIEAGANPPDLAVEYGHRYGMKVFPVVRMNDMHDQYYRFELSDFKRQHPEYLIGEDVDWEQYWASGPPPDKYKPGTIDSITWGMFDYAHEAVRTHKLAIIEEFIRRWDNDGVMLDFDRHPRYFRDGTDPHNQTLMTDLIRQVQAILDEVAAQRGRQQYLIVRVLPDIDETTRLGLDIHRWVEEGLVQVIQPGAGYAPLTLKLEPWLELVEGHDCWIFPSINHWRPLEETRAWGLTMRRAGAHGLNLFNWGHLLHGHPAGTIPQAQRTGTVWFSEVHPDYYQVLHEIGDVRTMEYKNNRYVLDSIPHERRPGLGGKLHREWHAVDDVILPVTLSVGTHRVDFQFGDDLQGAQQRGLDPSVTLRMKVNNYTAPDEFTVTVNGIALSNDTRTTRNDTWIEYPVPPELPKVGENYLEVVVESLNPQMAVVPVLTGVEIVITYDYVLDSMPREWHAIDDVILPVTLSVGTHRVDFQFGDDLQGARERGLDPSVTLRMNVNNYTAPDEFTVTVNGTALSNDTRTTRAVFIMSNDTWIEYPVPPELPKVGENYLEVVVESLNPQMAVVPVLTGVAIAITYD